MIPYVLSSAPDQRYEVDSLVIEGPLAAAMVTWRGTFTGEYLGVKGNGQRFSVAQSHLFRVEGGRLAEHWAVRDDLSVFRQTGVAPPA